MNTWKRLAILYLAMALVITFVPGLWAEETESISESAKKININKASAEELTQLKNVGPKYAERIVQYREEHGPFEHPEDIMKVPGIGPKTWEANKDRITVE